MTASRESLLAQLDDIKGLDRISWWPLALGWWMLLAVIVLTLAISFVIYQRRRAYWRSWKGDAAKTLQALRSQLADHSARETASALSVVLRCVAVQCFPRPECAGLQGKDWLSWLSAKDKAGFDWVANGSILIDAPYAPPNRNFPVEPLRMLIGAAMNWVK